MMRGDVRFATTTRGHVRCCGVPMPRFPGACTKCHNPTPDPNVPLYVGRAAWMRLRRRRLAPPDPLHAAKGTTAYACTGLRCGRPACTTERRARMVMR